LIVFSYILYSIQPELFWVAIVYAALGTIATVSLGRRLIPLNLSKAQREANFRFSLIRFRENSESIAFYKGTNIEEIEISKRFANVVQNKIHINTSKRNVDILSNVYRYLSQILPVSIVAPRYLAGKVELGILSQSTGAFTNILNDLSIVLYEFEEIAEFSATINRLEDFLLAIKESVSLTKGNNDTSPFLYFADEKSRSDNKDVKGIAANKPLDDITYYSSSQKNYSDTVRFSISRCAHFAT